MKAQIVQIRSHKPTEAWSNQKLEEGRKDPPLEPSEGV